MLITFSAILSSSCDRFDLIIPIFLQLQQYFYFIFVLLPLFTTVTLIAASPAIRHVSYVDLGFSCSPQQSADYIIRFHSPHAVLRMHRSESREHA